MGLPVCRPFIPSTHQVLTAKELIDRVTKTLSIRYSANYNDILIEYLDGALVKHKFSYGGKFDWNVRTLAYKLEGIISQVGGVEARSFFRCGDIIGLWHPQLLQWELTTELQAKNEEE